MTGSRHARGWVKTGFFLLLFAAGPAAVAQQPAKPAKKGQLRVEDLAEPPQSRVLPVLDFPGGTVLEYIEKLGGLEPSLNFVVTPRAGEIPLPPLALKQVSPETAIQLLEAVGRTSKAGVTASMIGQENSVWLIDAVEPARPLVPGGAPLAMAASHMAPPPVPDRVQVFSISLLRALQVKPETILTAVETALEMLPEAGGADGPAIKFHDEAGLLMVRGSGDEIRIVQEVLSSIEKGESGRVGVPPPATQTAGVIEALKAENEKLRMEVDLLKKRIESLLPGETPSAPRDDKQAR